MTGPWLFPALGALSGLLGITSRRCLPLGWVALAPVGYALVVGSPAEAALAAAIAGGLINSREIADPTMRKFGILAAVMSAGTWALVYAAVAKSVPSHPAWLALALPLSTWLVHLPVRIAGAPRWHSNPLASAQEPWLTVVHTARVGGDLTPTLLLSLSGAAIAMLSVRWPPDGTTILTAGGCLALLLFALILGRQSLKRATRTADLAPRVRVAAVVANAPAPPTGKMRGTWPIESADYKDVGATIARYAPHVESAARQGAKVIVLPEVGLTVDEDSLPRWLAAVSGWARSNAVTIVAPYLDSVRPKNELRVVGPDGQHLAHYEKQHPIAHLEGKRERRQAPGPWPVMCGDRHVALSTVLCVDLDYDDLRDPVRQAGGILAVPANDWPVFDELHHRAAVWAAVTTGVSIVRATGWGISAMFDGAGRVLAKASSVHQAAVLVADIPCAERG